MSNHWQPDEPLQSLLAAIIDGEPTSEQCEQLNRQLRDDPHAREYFVRTMSLHARLHARHAMSPAAEISGQASAQEGSSPARRHESRWRRRARQTYEFFARPTPLSLTVATLFLVALLGSMSAIAPPIYRVVTKGEWAAPQAPVMVARITESYGATWAADQVARHRDAHLPSGDKLELVAGLVEITYDNGASVLLEGPARYIVDQVERNEQIVGFGRLQQGKLTAHVPPQAVGFTIRTPMVELIDLGTEFGVEAQRDVTEIVVFEGKVAAQSSVASENQVPLEIQSGEAMRFDRSQPGGRTIQSQGQQFARRPSAAATADPDRYTAAVLASRPTGYWRLNDLGALAVSCTGRPHGLYHNGVKQGALPRPGDEAKAGSTQFDGQDDFVEIAHHAAHNGDDFSIEAWVLVDRTPSDFASIVTSRSDIGITTGYVLYVTPKNEWQLWTGTRSSWAIVEGPGAAIGQWTHVVATFQRIRTLDRSLVSGIGSLYINGQLVAHNDDLRYAPQRDSNCPLRIGAGATEQDSPKYYFPGQIADVAIYDQALTPEQIELHFRAATSQAP